MYYCSGSVKRAEPDLNDATVKVKQVKMIRENNKLKRNFKIYLFIVLTAKLSVLIRLLLGLLN